jgi:peptidoglycan/LPS O-acetylase OafA/YrhL
MPSGSAFQIHDPSVQGIRVSASDSGNAGKTRTKYRQEIDGIRGLAVIAVIINHFNKSLLPSGYLGVDIFFVISGHVVTASLFSHRHESIREFLLGFYSRRVRRLIPALVTCVVLTSLAICLFNPSPGISLRTGLTALFGFSNIYLFTQSTDYFAPTTDLNAFTQTWSLGVEEQFYMIYPLVMWLCGASPRGWRIKRVMIIVFALSLASLASYLLIIQSLPSAAFFLMPLRFWELGAGVLVFALRERRIFSRLERHGLLSLVTLSGMIATLFVSALNVATVTALVVVLSMLVITVITPHSIAYRILTLQPLLRLGLISYSLYLWHWSVLVIGRWTTGIHPWTVPFQLGAMLLLGLASYQWIETPFRRSTWCKSNAVTLWIGLGATSLAATLLASLGLSPSFSLYTGNRSFAKRSGQPTLASPYHITGLEGSGWKGKDCVLSDNTDVGKVIKEGRLQPRLTEAFSQQNTCSRKLICRELHHSL